MTPVGPGWRRQGSLLLESDDGGLLGAVVAWLRVARHMPVSRELPGTHAVRLNARATSTVQRFELHTALRGIERDVVLTPEQIDDLVDQLGPSSNFFSVAKSNRSFVVIAHNGTYSWWPKGDPRSTFMYRLEYEYQGVVLLTFTDDADYVRRFLKDWVTDEGDWRSTIKDWRDVNTPYRPPEPSFCSEHRPPEAGPPSDDAGQRPCPVCAAEESVDEDVLMVGRWWSNRQVRPATHYGWSKLTRWAFKPEPQDGPSPFYWMKSGGRPSYLNDGHHGRLLTIKATIRRVVELDGRLWHRIVRSKLAALDEIPAGVAEEMALEALERFRQ